MATGINNTLTIISVIVGIAVLHFLLFQKTHGASTENHEEREGGGEGTGRLPAAVQRTRNTPTQKALDIYLGYISDNAEQLRYNVQNIEDDHITS